MTLVLGLIVLFILGTAVAAVTARQLIHSALLLVLTWFGIAAFYLWAGAEFIAFAQVLIYAGAISMVVLFAVLLTRPSAVLAVRTHHAVRRRITGICVGGAVAAAISIAMLNTPLGPAAAEVPVVSVRHLGIELMGPHIIAVLIIGLTLTAALLGAVVIAASPKNAGGDDAS